MFRPFDGFARFDRITSREVRLELADCEEPVFSATTTNSLPEGPFEAWKALREVVQTVNERLEVSDDLECGTANVELLKHAGEAHKHYDRNWVEVSRYSAKITILYLGWSLSREYALGETFVCGETTSEA